MSTSDKLTYLNGTKQALKESINNLGGDITNETTFREYAQELDNIYDNLPKVSGEGSSITLAPTLKGKLDFENDIVGYGDTSQKSYSGKNLYPSGTSTQTIGGITFTPQEDGGLKLKGTSTYANYYVAGTDGQYVEVANLSNKAENMVLSVSGMQNGIQVYVVGTNLGVQGITNTDGTAIFTSIANDTYRIFIRVMAEYSVDTTLYIQLEKGNSATSFEKYVGGTASPNPSYPQDIEVVRGKNRLNTSRENISIGGATSTINYDDEGYITITNNNSSASYINIPIATEEIQVGEQYTLKVEWGTSELTYIYLQNSNDDYSKYVYTTTTTTATNTTISNFLKVLVLVNANKTIKVRLQVEKGSQATSYLPYNTIEVKARGKNKLDFSKWIETLMAKNPNITAGSINGYTNNSITITSNGNDCFTASYTISNNAATNKSFCETYPSLVQEVKENTKYTFSFERSNTSIISRPAFFFLDKDYNYLGLDDQDRTAVSSVTFTTPSNAKYLTFRFGLYGSTGSTLTISNLMIEESPSATSYEPYYTPQIKQLSLGEYEFAKIGNYVDTIEYDVDEDKVYKNEKIIKQIVTSQYINGLVAFNLQSINSYGIVNFLLQNISNSEEGLYDYIGLCNYLSPQVSLIANEQNEGILYQPRNVYIRIKSTTASTNQEFKTYVDSLNTNGNPLIIYRPTSTPTKTEITGTLKDQIKALYNSQSFNGTTIIESNGDLPMIIKVSALKGE